MIKYPFAPNNFFVANIYQLQPVNYQLFSLIQSTFSCLPEDCCSIQQHETQCRSYLLIFVLDIYILVYQYIYQYILVRNSKLAIILIIQYLLLIASFNIDFLSFSNAFILHIKHNIIPITFLSTIFMIALLISLSLGWIQIRTSYFFY